MRKALLVSLWFPAAFIFLIINLAILGASSHGKITTPLSASPLGDTNFQLTASAGTAQVLGATVIAGDARSLLLQSFLEQHSSPMAQYADTIVQQADKNGIDFRLATAIAMCESNLGKYLPTHDSYNAWGVSCYTGQDEKCSKFSDWPSAIAWVSEFIKNKFYNNGIVDLKAIGAVWAPPSVNTGYSWTNCVETFKNSIY